MRKDQGPLTEKAAPSAKGSGSDFFTDDDANFTHGTDETQGALFFDVAPDLLATRKRPSRALLRRVLMGFRP